VSFSWNYFLNIDYDLTGYVIRLPVIVAVPRFNLARVVSWAQESEPLLNFRQQVTDVIIRFQQSLSSGFQEYLQSPYRSDLTRSEIPADRKSTRLNSSHVKISYAVFCLKKK